MDFDRRTGARLSNYESALQSVEIILFTRIGDRVMRREFGAGIVELLGRKMTPRLFASFQILLATAIDLWEPRFRVRRVTVTGSIDEVRLGRAGFQIEVEFRPNGHLDDLRVESVQTFSLFPGLRAGVSS